MRLNVRNVMLDDDRSIELEDLLEETELASKASSVMNEMPIYNGRHFVRLMSANEFSLLMQGEKLYNFKNHGKAGRKSHSIGFCFAPIEDWESGYEIETTEGYEWAVENFDEFFNCQVMRRYRGPYPSDKGAYELIADGISDRICSESSEVAVIFLANEQALRKTYGIYANIHSDDWNDFAEVAEMSTVSYSKETMIPVAAFLNFHVFGRFDEDRIRVI